MKRLILVSLILMGCGRADLGQFETFDTSLCPANRTVGDVYEGIQFLPGGLAVNTFHVQQVYECRVSSTYECGEDKTISFTITAAQGPGCGGEELIESAIGQTLTCNYDYDMGTMKFTSGESIPWPNSLVLSCNGQVETYVY